MLVGMAAAGNCQSGPGALCASRPDAAALAPGNWIGWKPMPPLPPKLKPWPDPVLVGAPLDAPNAGVLPPNRNAPVEAVLPCPNAGVLLPNKVPVGAGEGAPPAMQVGAGWEPGEANGNVALGTGPLGFAWP